MNGRESCCPKFFDQHPLLQDGESFAVFSLDVYKRQGYYKVTAVVTMDEKDFEGPLPEAPVSATTEAATYYGGQTGTGTCLLYTSSSKGFIELSAIIYVPSVKTSR